MEDFLARGAASRPKDVALVCGPSRLTFGEIERRASAPVAVPEEVRAYCARHLEGHKVPRRVVVRPSLPRTASGKVDRQALLAETH